MNALFYLALSFMIIHEMDAVRCREWRIFPGLSRLNESPLLKYSSLLIFHSFYSILGFDLK